MTWRSYPGQISIAGRRQECIYAGRSGRHNSKTLVTPGHGMYSVKRKNEMLPCSGLVCSFKEIDEGLGGKTGKTNENVKFLDLLSAVRYHFWKKDSSAFLHL